MHILGNLQFLETVAEICADAHYYFPHSIPWGSKASSLSPMKRTLSHQGRTKLMPHMLAISRYGSSTRATKHARTLLRQGRVKSGKLA